MTTPNNVRWYREAAGHYRAMCGDWQYIVIERDGLWQVEAHRFGGRVRKLGAFGSLRAVRRYVAGLTIWNPERA